VSRKACSFSEGMYLAFFNMGNSTAICSCACYVFSNVMIF
jgi:hypothetical protein